MGFPPLRLLEDNTLKRGIILIFMACVVWNSTAFAQERGPLVMQVEFEWTLIGVIAGAGLGVLLWLTDPANPNNVLSDSLANGAAWGAVLGAGFGVFVLQETGVSPPATVQVQNPLNPRNRITTDPVAVESGERNMFASGSIGKRERGTLIVPLFKMRF